MADLKTMMSTDAQTGRVAWIGVRPERRADLEPVRLADLADHGLSGDHAKGGKRAVTLIQAEHLPVIAALLGRDAVRPEDLRRNIVVSGLNLAALRKSHVAIGTAVLAVEGPCPPCSRMEETFGPGGYSAVRGHGGWYASIVTTGRIAVGDTISRT